MKMCVCVWGGEAWACERKGRYSVLASVFGLSCLSHVLALGASVFCKGLGLERFGA